MEYTINASVLNINQLKTLLSYDETDIPIIYVDSGIELDKIKSISLDGKKKLYLIGPAVLRNEHINDLMKMLSSGLFEGILVKNLETLSYLNANINLFRNLKIVIDNTMYICNKEAFRFILANSLYDIKEYYNSFELNTKEIKHLRKSIDEDYDEIAHSTVIYGRIPMMVSANCVQNTLKGCNKNHGFVMLNDRMNKSFPVFCNCKYCYNVIYNSLPLSLHNYTNECLNFGNLRLDFTNEDEDMLIKVLKYFNQVLNHEDISPFYEYTNGHYKNSIE